MTKKTDKRAFSVDAIHLDMYKNVINISETLVHFKDILKALIDMGTKNSTDIQLMNQKWATIKDKMNDVGKCVDEIKHSTDAMVSQLDLKEKQKFVKALEDKKFKWKELATLLLKNPILLTLIIIIVVGFILVAAGLISGDIFWKGITGSNLPKPN